MPPLKSPRVLAVALVTIAAMSAPPAALSLRAAPKADRQLELQLVRDINGFRQANGLPPLRQNASLLTAARRHSGEMASDGYFGHDSFDGSPFWKRLDGARPRGHRWLSAGENLYWGTSDVTADAVTWAWMTSPEHRTILLSPAWRGMGISAIRAPAAPGTFGGEDVVIVTADFGG